MDGPGTNSVGRSVSMVNMIVARYSIRDSSMGKAYVFKRTDDERGEEAHLEASDGSTGDKFGWSIDTDGEHVVVGARTHLSALVLHGAKKQSSQHPMAQ